MGIILKFHTNICPYTWQLLRCMPPFALGTSVLPSQKRYVLAQLLQEARCAHFAQVICYIIWPMFSFMYVNL